MNKTKVSVLSIIVLLLIALSLTGCTESKTVSSNLSTDAENFKILRKLTFINTVNNEVLYTVEGNFSIYADSSDNQLEITAKTGNDTYQKHFLGLSPTTVYIVEQLEWLEENKYQFKITIRPSALIPDIEIAS